MFASVLHRSSAALRRVPVTATFSRNISMTPLCFKENGTLKWFNKSKGYGFIQPDSGGKDIFVHWSAFGRSTFNLYLPDGIEVEFNVGQTEKGSAAEDVLAAGGKPFEEDEMDSYRAKDNFSRR